MVGLFAGWIGDAPGNEEELFAASAGFLARAQELEERRWQLRDVLRLAPDWAGQAREAFAQELDKVQVDVADLSFGYDDGGQALEVFAWVVRDAKRQVADMRAALEGLDRQLEAAAGDYRVVKYLELLPSAGRIDGDYARLVAGVRQEEEACAARLRECFHFEAVHVDENGVYLSDRRALSSAELARIWDGFAGLRPTDMTQGYIGDCYYLAALMALSNTPDGRRTLQEAIQPRYDSRGNIVGFLVTVYDDPLHPTARAQRTVFVDSVYKVGANRTAPNMFSIFESAYGQLHPEGTRPGPAGIYGGLIDEALRDAGDMPNTVIERSKGIWGLGEGYSPTKQAQIAAALESQKPVTASTTMVPAEHFPHDGSALVVDVNQPGLPPVRLHYLHAYMVEAADENGVTLINPHGANHEENLAARHARLKLSWEDFGHYFGSVAIGE